MNKVQKNQLIDAIKKYLSAIPTIGVNGNATCYTFKTLNGTGVTLYIAYSSGNKWFGVYDGVVSNINGIGFVVLISDEADGDYDYVITVKKFNQIKSNLSATAASGQYHITEKDLNNNNNGFQKFNLYELIFELSRVYYTK